MAKIMPTFAYHPDIIEKYSSIVGGVILASDLSNTAISGDLLTIYGNEQAETIKRIGKTPLSKIESLAAWRTTFRQFGVDPTQYRSAAESLLRRLTKKGDIPSINPLVDVGNLVSIRYALPVAVFDTRHNTGTLTVQFADGTEPFTPLGKKKPEHPTEGEVVFADDDSLVAARRWCWRQSDQSAAREDTTDAIITVEAHHEEGRADVVAAVNDLTEMLTRYIGGTFSSAILDKERTTV